MTPTVESAYCSVGRRNSTRVDEERKCSVLVAMKMEGETRRGEGEKSILIYSSRDPGSDYRSDYSSD